MKGLEVIVEGAVNVSFDEFVRLEEHNNSS